MWNLEIKIKISDKDSLEIYNIQEYNKLTQLKDTINEATNILDWDKAKKLINPYELVYTPNRKLKFDSIADHNPLSRAYFKFWEILQIFSSTNPFLNDAKEIKTAHVAEGPGGFMEALVNFRNNRKDKLYGITLYSCNKDIPGWKKTYNLLKQNPNIHVVYGKDGTGNIYNPDNILDFQTHVGFNSADIVTADGGFDFSFDFNKQEHHAIKLIYCEIVTALAVQKVGGMFVCKLFDLYTIFTVKLMYLIKSLYTDVRFFKPSTSRPANSEKYLVATGFKGIDPLYLQQLINVIHIWNHVEKQNKFIIDVFANNIPYDFYRTIDTYNISCFKIQQTYINKTMSILKNSCSISYSKILIQHQIKNAVNWCIKNNIPVNNKSYFIKYLNDTEEDSIES